MNYILVNLSYDLNNRDKVACISNQERWFMWYLYDLITKQLEVK